MVSFFLLRKPVLELAGVDMIIVIGPHIVDRIPVIRSALVFVNNHTSIFLMNFAGTPPTTVIGGTSFVTTAPAATIEP